MGEPYTVAEELAKIHKLSVFQVIAEILFTVFIVLKIIDVCFISLVSGFGSLNFAQEAALMVVVVIVGFIMSLRHKRILPALMSVIYMAFDFVAISSFGYVFFSQVTGNWETYITNYGLDFFSITKESIDVTVLVISLLAAVAVLVIFLIIYFKIRDCIKLAYYSTLRFKKVFYWTSVVSLCLVVALTVATKIYINQNDIKEKEEWSKVTSELCDFCTENEKITEDDIYKVIEYFDYLEFKEYNHHLKYDCKYHLSATVGEKSITNPHLSICVSDSGDVVIESSYYSLGNYQSYNPFMCLRIFKINTVWSDLGKSFNTFDGLKEGDDAVEFMSLVKNNSLRFIYMNIDNEIRYETCLEYDHGLGGYRVCVVDVESGKITRVVITYH